MRMPVSFVKRSIRSSITLPSAPVRPFQKLIVGFAWPAAGRPRAVVRAAAPSATVPPMKRRRVSPRERDGLVMVWLLRASQYGSPRGGVNVRPWAGDRARGRESACGCGTVARTRWRRREDRAMTPGPDHITLINAARVLDGSGGPPTEPAALLIADERIVRLGRPEEVRPPEGARVTRVDYGAATVLPGLVDAHTHLVSPGDGTAGDDVAKEDDGLLLLQAAKNARTLLHSGVTTLRENGAKGRVAFALREGVRRQLAPGPRMVICGRPITITGGHMGYFGSEADGEAAVRAAVRRLLKEGADYIKIVATGGSTRTSDPNRPSYTVSELAAITDEARRQGKLTAAHCTCAQGVENCLEAGVDMIIHCVFNEADGSYRYRPDLV